MGSQPRDYPQLHTPRANMTKESWKKASPFLYTKGRETIEINGAEFIRLFVDSRNQRRYKKYSTLSMAKTGK